MIYGYVRVSTDKQTVENQRFEIEKFVQKENKKIDRWIDETISGTVAVEKRKLGSLLKRLKKGDILVASEISRLGRNMLQIMSILHHCMKNEVQVWTIKDNYRLGADIQSKVLAFAFGLSAEIERNLISQRTKEALARKKAEGIILGRPKGSISALNLTCSQKSLWIQKKLAQGMYKTDIAKKLHIARGTLYRFLSNAETTSTSAGSQSTECNSVMLSHLAASCSKRVNSPPTTEQ